MKTVQGYTDIPLLTNEHDSFDVQFYIDGLCDYIRNCSTPMTISIQGAWGSGKTSMMNMIKEKLSDEVVPVWFNTWKYSQFDMQDRLVFSMLNAIIGQLTEGCNDLKDNFVANISKIARIVTVSTIAQFSSMAAEEVNAALTSCSEDLTVQIDEIKKQFDEAVENALKIHKREKVVIFIDDLDRLHPQKAVELLEVIKLFLDCKHCVFILAVDYDVVALGIRIKFGDIVPTEKGKSFFDKIIQLPFKMPVAQYNVQKFVSEMLEGVNIVNLSKKDISDYVKLIRTSIGFNPRSMKRLFNSFLLLNTIMQKQQKIKESIGKQLDDKLVIQQQKILFAILCMQLVYDELYNYIVQNISGITTDTLTALTEFKSLEKYSDIQHIIKQLSDSSVQRLIRFMRNLVECLQLDEDKDLSDEELNSLKNMLMFSTITAVGQTQVEDENLELQELRRINRWIAKQANHAVEEWCEKNTSAKPNFNISQSDKEDSQLKYTYAKSCSENPLHPLTPWHIEIIIQHNIERELFSMEMSLFAFKGEATIESITQFAKENNLPLIIHEDLVGDLYLQCYNETGFTLAGGAEIYATLTKQRIFDFLDKIKLV